MFDDDVSRSADDEAAAPILSRPCQHTPGRTTLSQRWGALTLTTDRVRFVRDNGTTTLDAPLSDVHSVANWLGRGVVLHAAADRWRFDFSHESPMDELRARTSANSPALAALEAGSFRSSDIDVRMAAREWTRELQARGTGSPPPGLRIGRVLGPDERWKYIARSLLACAVVAAAIVGVMLLLFL